MGLVASWTLFLPALPGAGALDGGLLAQAATLGAALFWFGFAIWALAGRNRARRESLGWAREAAFLRRIAGAMDGLMLRTPGGEIWFGGKARKWLGIDRDRLDVRQFESALAPRIGEDACRALLERLEGASQADELILHLPDGRMLTAEPVADVDPAVLDGARLLRLKDGAGGVGENAAPALAGDRRAHMAQSLRTMLNAAPFPVWLRDETLDIIAVNDAYVRAVEQPDAAAVIERQVEIVSNALTGSSRDSARRAQEKGAAVSERHFAVLAGQRRALAIHDIPVDGQVVGIAIDMTDVEEIRAELARVIESHSETLNSLSSPVAIFDADQRLRFSNSAFARLFRLSEDWLAEGPDHGSLLEAMRERRRLPEQADFQAWKKQQLDLYHSPEPTEDMWHLPDGSSLRAVAQPHPLGGLLVFYEDVTDRLALEGSYNTLIAVQRETLNHLHEAVAVYGSDARLKLYNPNYARIWQLDPAFLDSEPHFGEILDHARALLDTGNDWAARKARLIGQLAERETRAGRWHRPDGKVLDYAMVPLPDGRVMTTHIDVTDSFRIEHALRERNEALETADRLKSEFVANMSYELRTPLNTIIGFAELMDGDVAGTLSARQRDYVRYVLRAAGQLRDLIDDILDLAVIEAGVMSLDITEIPVADLLENVAGISREQARKAGLELVVKCDPGCGSIEGDQRRLTQAIYNLVANSVKFTPRGGRITLRARPAGDDGVEITVRDTGIGIDEEDREAIFEKFHTGTRPSSRKGVGLGLSLVRSFIELHRGRISLVSRPTEGTTVTCVLPRRQAADAQLKRAI